MAIGLAILLQPRPVAAALQERHPWWWRLLFACYLAFLAWVLWQYPQALGGSSHPR